MSMLRPTHPDELARHFDTALGVNVNEGRVGTVTNPSRRPPEAYQYLPLYAKVAIERLDADYTLRTAATLDELLTAYATTYGESVTDEYGQYVRFSAHYRCAKRFSDFRIAT